MKFTLGRFVFRTKGDAVKAVLNSALPGLFLSGDELELVAAVLDRHHDRENKLSGDVPGESLTSFNLNIDYAGEWPFRRIVEEFVEWAAREGLSLRLAQSGIFTIEFANPRATQAFRDFHNARATLRLVTQEINQSWEREEAAKAAEETGA